jgi:hypothetical protein
MKRILFLLAALSFGALTAPLARAVPPPIYFPTSEDWNVNGNGSKGKLHISGVDGIGNILPGSTIYGQPIFGFYDFTSARINFIRVLGPLVPYTLFNPTQQQVFNGYLFADPTTATWYLAGDFTAYQGSGGAAQRITYGWFASAPYTNP